MKLRSQIIRLCILIALLGARPIAAQDALLAGFDAYVAKARADWEVPGLAIAIVKDDKIVFAKGYGVRKLGDPAPVNERTTFAIGSASKAFTVAALAMLVDAGKLKWDDPVTKHLTDFMLYDPYITREITVRDLLCHRSGLDRAEPLWYGSTLDRDEILRRVRYQKPEWSFRSHFGYNNIMFLAAGQIIPAVTGQSWDDFIKQRIFAPLGMTSSSTSVAALKNFENVATPHEKTGQDIQPMAWRSVDNCAPAGAINSNAVDMAQWLRLQLSPGSYEDKKLISLGAMEEMRTPQMNITQELGIALMAPEAHFVSYGFGWMLHDYHGRKIVEHGGAIDGMIALVGMIPEEKLGVVILTNFSPNQLPLALMYRVFDAYLGLPAQDWSGRMLKLRQIQEMRLKAVAKKTAETRVKDTKPSLALQQYAGTYQNQMYGEAKVSEERGKLVLRYSPTFSGELEHWHYDTFHIKWAGSGLPDSFVTFTLNAQGKVAEMKVENLDDFKRALERTSTVK